MIGADTGRAIEFVVVKSVSEKQQNMTIAIESDLNFLGANLLLIRRWFVVSTVDVADAVGVAVASSNLNLIEKNENGILLFLIRQNGWNICCWFFLVIHTRMRDKWLE